MNPALEKDLALDRIVAALRATGATVQPDALASFTAVVGDELRRMTDISATIAEELAMEGNSPSWKDACRETAVLIRESFQKAHTE